MNNSFQNLFVSTDIHPENAKTNNTYYDNRIKESQNMFSQLNSDFDGHVQSPTINYNEQLLHSSTESIQCYQIPKIKFQKPSCESIEDEQIEMNLTSKYDCLETQYVPDIPDVIILQGEHLVMLAQRLNIDYKLLHSTIISIIEKKNDPKNIK